MALPSLPDALRDVVDYINVSAANNSALTADAARRMVEDTLAMAHQIPHAEATRCLMTLSTAALFSASDKAAFAASINQKVAAYQAVPVSGTQTPTPARQRNQTCITIHNYLTCELWEMMSDTRFSWEAVKHGIVDRLSQLGLLFPSEQTLLTLW